MVLLRSDFSVAHAAAMARRAKKRTAEDMEACDLVVARRGRICKIEQLRGQIAHVEAEQELGDAHIRKKISSMIHIKGSFNYNRALFELLLTGVFWRLEKEGPLLVRCLGNPLFKLALRHWQPASQKEAIEFFLRACDGVNRGQYPSVLRKCPLLLRTMLGQWSPGYGAEAIPYKKQIHKRFDMYSYFFLAFDLSLQCKQLPRKEEIDLYFTSSQAFRDDVPGFSDSISDDSSDSDEEESEDIDEESDEKESDDINEKDDSDEKESDGIDSSESDIGVGG